MVNELITVESLALRANDDLAEMLRLLFESNSLAVSNWISSPGSGKTALISKLCQSLAVASFNTGVLVGDCATENDANRISSFGIDARQIITEGMCHLEASMIYEKIIDWNLSDFQFLIIENVGNLVCPSAFGLGESMRVALISTTEGEDKPLKYPALFSGCDLVVVTKMDLAPYCDFDQDALLRNISAVAGRTPVVMCSSKTGEGIDALADHLIAARNSGFRNVTLRPN